MDLTAFTAAGDALVTLMDPFRLMMLSFGVVFGLFLGIVPGIGGLAGMALLLPFTYTMDSYAAFAMLLGMLAVSGTSDTITAILFGVPGSAGAQALVMDGYPLAKQGQAGRALSAAYTSSLIGGVFGALILAVTIPILRPIMLHIGSPELLGFSVFGIAMVAVLSGTAPLRGLIAACLGILLSMIGADSQTGTLRYTMNSFYLWDGLQLMPIVLGLFAIPELAEIAVKRLAISNVQKIDVRAGMREGVMDAFKNWWLVIRGGALGAGIGAIPGLGSSVVDWIAYGWAYQTYRNKPNNFGKGDIRGVIAPESANNAITAGALVPTIAFGVPGSGTMAILLSVFLIHGLVPGPEMLTTNLNMSYSMVWSIALANIAGAGLCFMFSGQFAKIATLRYTLILPIIVVFVVVGAFTASSNWGDLMVMLIFAVIGYVMKAQRWPRPPLLLGFVLGTLVERYMFISTSRYGLDWIGRPMVIVLLTLAAVMLIGPFYRQIKSYGGPRGLVAALGRPQVRIGDMFYIFLMAVAAYALIGAWSWQWGARVGPMVVTIGMLAFCTISLLNTIFSRGIVERRVAAGTAPPEGLHMDSDNQIEGITPIENLRRTAIFFGYVLFLLGLMALVGLILAIPIFVLVYMRVEGKEKWHLPLIIGTVLAAFVFLVFDYVMHIPWPATVLGHFVPALSFLPSV